MDCTNLAFEAEWLDEESGLNRSFIMIYFPECNKVQLFEPRTNKMFLKKSAVEGLRPEDVYVGSEITILARQFRLQDFADEYTRKMLECRNERTFALIKPDCVKKMGTVFSEIQSTNLLIRTATLAVLSEAQAQDFYKEHMGKPFLPALVQYVTSGPVLAMQLQGEGAVATWRRMIGDTDPAQAHPESLRARFGKSIVKNGFHGAQDKAEALREIEFFFPDRKRHLAPPSSAKFNDSTCCIVKPQALLDKNLGPIINCIYEAGFDITGLEVMRFDRVKASEFHEVYNGVLYEFADMVAQLQAGPCVALEIAFNQPEVNGREIDLLAERTIPMDERTSRQKKLGVVQAFRELVGPLDPVLAKKLRPNSLRAKYGESKTLNAIHCTDLPEDAPSEIEYCFKIMRN